MPLQYRRLSDELCARLQSDRARHAENPYRTDDAQALRRDETRSRPQPWRTAFARDVEAILHSPYYNRYADKTQVFSFYRNDDITRRALHVQLVSRTARTIGAVLGLNLDLIEAIALGHDMGHTPFGHAGERCLSELLYAHTGRVFSHNAHSVRVLDTIFARNLAIQTLDGILCHNGEIECREYRPAATHGFDVLDAQLAQCGASEHASAELTPMTLEGCVVRICDIIAYLGKDRQDAQRAHLPYDDTQFSGGALGTENAEIINNMTVSILENSYGRGYIGMDEDTFAALTTAKRENYKLIYQQEAIVRQYDEVIRPMFKQLYTRLRTDLLAGDRNAVIFRHHVDFVERNRLFYGAARPYLEETPDDIVVDYLASMTDDYFLDLYAHLFPGSALHVDYISYFDDKWKE
ncbi:MAG: phosphohydrolase [Clostridium sp. SCN 57-10]|nr:MAG: phosphohydrolase [Clostridium sp. SCN 57-10]